jgi:transketolase
MRAILRWAVEDAEENVAIRLAIGPSPRHIDLPSGYEPTVGRGIRLREGEDAVLLAYGPVLLHEALLASERLAEHGIRLAVVNMPWLNRADPDWLTAEIAPYEHVLVVDDHAPVGGLGDTLRRALDDRRVTVYGVEGWPACGTPEEALGFHELDGASLARRIAVQLGVR